MSMRTRLFALVTGIVLVLAALLAARLAGPGAPSATSKYGVSEGKPPALAIHLARLARTAPELTTEKGVDGAAEFEFMQRAYPSDTIPLAQARARRAAL